jgi:hypothetical protein
MDQPPLGVDAARLECRLGNAENAAIAFYSLQKCGGRQAGRRGFRARLCL